LQVPVPTKFCASQEGSQRYHYSPEEELFNSVHPTLPFILYQYNKVNNLLTIYGTQSINHLITLTDEPSVEDSDSYMITTTSVEDSDNYITTTSVVDSDSYMTTTISVEDSII
jgi:hypothetical protein